MKIKITVVAAVFGLMLSGCVTTATAPAMTPLQLQAVQSKQFETTKDIGFAATISVFQDLGYIVNSADKSTGFITAQGATKNSTGVFEAFAGGSSSSHTKATAFIEELRANNTNIRLNFVVSNHSSSAYGRESANDHPVTDPETYKNAFDKIDQAIFIRQ